MLPTPKMDGVGKFHAYIQPVTCGVLAVTTSTTLVPFDYFLDFLFPIQPLVSRCGSRTLKVSHPIYTRHRKPTLTMPYKNLFYRDWGRTDDVWRFVHALGCYALL